MASSSVSQSAAIPPACLFAFQNQLLSKRFLILCTTWLPPPPLIPLLRLTLSSMKGACRSSVRGLRLILCMANWVAGYCQFVIGGRVVRPAVQRADLRGRGCNGRTYHPGRWIVCEVFVWLLLPPPRRLCVRTLFVGWFVGPLESRWRIF